MNRLHRARGFTLLEILVALFILAVGLLGMAKMQIHAVRGSSFGGRMTTAVALARYQMEFLMNQDLSTLAPELNPWPLVGPPVTVELTPKTDPLIMGKAYPGYTINWGVTANAPDNNLATLRVQVSWPEGQNPIQLVAVRRK